LRRALERRPGEAGNAFDPDHPLAEAAAAERIDVRQVVAIGTIEGRRADAHAAAGRVQPCLAQERVQVGPDGFLVERPPEHAIAQHSRLSVALVAHDGNLEAVVLAVDARGQP